MAFPTAVNSQTTDSVTQTNVEVVSLSPAVAMGNLYTATSQALGNAAHVATQAMQQGSLVYQSATLVGVSMLYVVGKQIADSSTSSNG